MEKLEQTGVTIYRSHPSLEDVLEALQLGLQSGKKFANFGLPIFLKARRIVPGLKKLEQMGVTIHRSHPSLEDVGECT